MLSKELRRRKVPLLLLIVSLFALFAGYALAQEPAPGTAVSLTDSASAAKRNISAMPKGYAEGWLTAKPEMNAGTAARGRLLSSSSAIRLPVTAADFVTNSLAGTTACSNIVINTQLDILEFGDGFGTAEPWVFLEPYLYYVNENDPGDPFASSAYDGYSLLFEDGDPGDPSPNLDMFGQGFFMPDNLSDVTVEYWRATVDGNPQDHVYGELWLLDSLGNLHYGDINYFVGAWELSESNLKWKMESVAATENMVKKLDGQLAALLFFNVTDGSLPGAPEAQKEWLFIDEISLIACYKPDSSQAKKLYIPTVQKAKQGPPLCVPPTENPQDQYNSNRGFAQTSAICNSSLSELDKADYYTFKPSTSGSHTLHLNKLPAGTEWSAMIFEDKQTPEYAPGDTAGQCRIDTPGSKAKQVRCTLDKNKTYFIKVSAGSTPMAGSYDMAVLAP